MIHFSSNRYNVTVLSECDGTYFIQYTVPVRTGVMRRTKCSYEAGSAFRDSSKEGLVDEIEKAIMVYNAKCRYNQ